MQHVSVRARGDNAACWTFLENVQFWSTKLHMKCIHKLIAFLYSIINLYNCTTWWSVKASTWPCSSVLHNKYILMFHYDLVINPLDTLSFNYICSMHNYSDSDIQSATSWAKRKDILTLLNIKITLKTMPTSPMW